MSSQAFEILLGARVPLPDGIFLNAAIFMPRDVPMAPVLLTMTPYSIDFCYPRAASFAAEGYAVVVVEVRGRGSSEGDFSLYGNASDGAVCIEWAAQQSCSNGKVGLFGGSYSGLLQWAIAALKPQGLASFAPLCAPMPGFDADGQYPFFPLDNLRWSTFIRGTGLHSQLLKDDSLWLKVFENIQGRHASLDDLPVWFGERDTPLAEMIERFVSQDVWDDAVPSVAAMKEITVPSLSITGTADNAQAGCIQYCRRLRQARPDLDSWLVVGPWTHGGSREEESHSQHTRETEALERTETALLLDFYNYTLRGEPLSGPLQHGRNLVYVNGAETWVCVDDSSFETTDPPSRSKTTYGLKPRWTAEERTPEAPRKQEPSPIEKVNPGITLFNTLGGEKAWNNPHVRPEDTSVVTLSGGFVPAGTRLIGYPEVHIEFTTLEHSYDIYALLYGVWATGETRVISTAQARLSQEDVTLKRLKLNRWRFVSLQAVESFELRLQLSEFRDPAYLVVDATSADLPFTDGLQADTDRCWVTL